MNRDLDLCSFPKRGFDFGTNVLVVRNVLGQFGLAVDKQLYMIIPFWLKNLGLRLDGDSQRVLRVNNLSIAVAVQMKIQFLRNFSHNVLSFLLVMQSVNQ